MYVDPSFHVYSITNGQKTIQDATIYSGYSQEEGYLNWIYAGAYPGRGTARSLVKFPGLVYTDPFQSLNDSQITSVKYMVYNTNPQYIDPSTINVYMLTRGWSEPDVKYDSLLWNAAGQQLDSKNLTADGTSSSGTGTGNWYGFNITSAALQWKNYTAANHGIMLRDTVESKNVKAFYSSDSASGSPFVVVEYSQYISTPAPGVESGDVYYLQNFYSDRYMDVFNGGTENGTNLIQYDFHGGINQQMKLIRDAGTGYYKIAPMNAPGKVLTIGDYGYIVLGEDCSLDSQLWRIETNCDAYYFISRTDEKSFLSVQNNSTANAANLVVSQQVGSSGWRLPSGVYSYNGHTIAIYGGDNSTLDDVSPPANTLVVFANDLHIQSARLENGIITVCMAEIAQALCTDYFLDPQYTYWDVTTSHYDLQTYYQKRYYTSDLGICPIDGVRDRISLTQFVNDMGYSTKYSSLSYANGGKEVYIQGHAWYSADYGDEFLKSMSSLLISFIPVVGDAKDLVEGVGGKDFITGYELTEIERVISVSCTFIPVVNGAIVTVGKKGITKIDNIIEATDTLSDAAKITIRTDVWNVLRPTTRGLFFEADFAKNVYKLTDGWEYVGKAKNGFFPVIDFLKPATDLAQTKVISLKTLDPRLYRYADGSYNTVKMTGVINDYIDKLASTTMKIDSTNITIRQLDLVVPDGYASVINSLSDLETSRVLWNLIEH